MGIGRGMRALVAVLVSWAYLGPPRDSGNLRQSGNSRRHRDDDEAPSRPSEERRCP
jgi:hypothetical protein